VRDEGSEMVCVGRAKNDCVQGLVSAFRSPNGYENDSALRVPQALNLPTTP